MCILNILCQCFYVCVSVCQCVCVSVSVGDLACVRKLVNKSWCLCGGKIYVEKIFENIQKNLKLWKVFFSHCLRGNWWIKADVCVVAWETIRGVIRRSHVSTCLCPQTPGTKITGENMWFICLPWTKEFWSFSPTMFKIPIALLAISQYFFRVRL